jgi:hypothetical protein
VGAHAGILQGFGDDDSHWSAGKVGGALLLDGVDDFVEIDGHGGLCGRQPRTIAAWINTTERSSAPMTIIAWGAPDAGQSFALEIDPSGRFKVTCDGALSVAGDQLVGDKRWHHVAAVLAPLEAQTPRLSDVRLYVDGRRQNLYGLTEQEIDTACDATIKIGASHNPDDPAWFGGSVDDVQLFDVALSAQNIADLHAGTDI